MKNSKNTVLVAIMNSKTDFEIAKSKNWYRIPVKFAPPIVREGEIEHIAFYHTKTFEQEKHTIQWWAKVNKVSIVKRKELFPNEPFDTKAENDYYKIEFSSMIALPSPIVSHRPRRVLFIPTTEEKFFNSSEINYLFNDSPLENLLWGKFVSKEITAERQFYISIGKNKYILDFAIFCKARNIDVECDGDQFHTTKNAIQSDKRRNNQLESIGWGVLRFTTEDLKKEIDGSVDVINEAINRYGGIQDVDDLEAYKYISKDDDPQMMLFD